MPKKKKNTPNNIPTNNIAHYRKLDGTLGRSLFVTFLALICFVLVVLHVQTEPTRETGLVSGALLYLIVAVAGFGLFDAVYVWLQHLHPLSKTLDRVALFIAELGAITLFITPFIIEMSLNQLYVNVWLPLGLGILLVIRYIVGILFSKE